MTADLPLTHTAIHQNLTGLTDTAALPGFWKKKILIIYTVMIYLGQVKANVNKILEIKICL